MCHFSPAAHPHFWRKVLPDIVFLVDSSFLLELWIHHPIAFWPARFLWESAESLIKTHLYVIIHFFLAAFKKMSFKEKVFNFWQFDYNVPWCGVSLVYSHWSFLEFVCPFLSSDLESFWLLFHQISSLCLSLFPFWDFPNVYMVHLMVSHSPLGAHQFSSFCFLFAPLSQWFQMTFLHVHWFFFSCLTKTVVELL